MSFASPVYLLALLAVPLLGALWAFERRRRRSFAVRHPGVAALRGASGRSGRQRFLAPALMALALALLGIGFAKPERTVAVPVEKASVMLVTDGSGSMLAEDVSPSRLEAAQSAAQSFLDEVPDELLVGFTGYADAVQTLLEPTADHDEIS